MMKRLLASCLAFLMLASTLMLSPGLLAFADEEQVLFSEDFEDEARVSSYASSKISYAASGDAAHNGVGRVVELSGETGWSSAWPVYLRLRTADADKLVLEAGKTYTLSYDVKRNAALPNPVKVKLIFASNIGNLGEGGDGIDHTTNATNTIVLRTLDATSDPDFVTYTETFTIPETFTTATLEKGVNFALIMNGQGNKVACDFYVDNLRLTTAQPTEDPRLFAEDFEDETRVNKYGKVVYYKTDDATHRGVGKITIINGETGWGSAWPVNMRLNHNGVEPLLLEAGETYTLSYDLMRGSMADPFMLKLIFANNMSNLSFYNDGTDNTTNATNTLTIRSFAAGSDAGFVHYVDTFTVPEDFSAEDIAKGANLALIKAGTANKFDCEILLDNFLLEKGEPSEQVDTVITFDDPEQQKFYFTDGYSSQCKQVTDEDEAHGTALQIYHINQNGTGENNAVAWPPRVALYQPSGEPMVAEKDAVYRIDFDLKVVNIYDSVVPIRLFLAFDDGSRAYVDFNRNARDTNGIELTSFSDASGDWVHVSKIITAPVDKTMFIVAHHNGTVWLSNYNDWDVRLDNICVKQVTPCRVKLHSNNGTDEVVEYNTYTGLSVDELPVPTPPDDATFDGWYLDDSLSRRAETVTENGEYWAGWVNNAPVQQVTYNTFEHEGIAYDDTRAPESKSTRVEEDDGNHIYRYVVAERNTSQWPANIALYDSETLAARFYPRANAAYRIRFRYRVNARPDRKLVFQLLRIGRLSNPGNPNNGYSADNLYLSEIAAVSEPTADWQTVEKIFYTQADGKDWFLSLSLVSTDDSNAKDVNVDVDDIEIEQVVDGARYFTFDTNGGDPLDRRLCVAGDNVPSLPIPQKDGFYFEGWFLDDACVTPFAESAMPDRDLTLYAGWTQLPVEVTSFSTGFEPTDYDAPPYANTDAATAKSDQNMSAAVVWHNNSITDAYGGQGFVSLTNTPEKLSQSNSAAWHSISLINRDGSRFKVVAGQRYHLTYAFQVMQSSGQVVNLVVSEYTPVQGIQTNHCTVLHSMSYSELYTGVSPTEWGVYDVYFLAQKTGNVYLTYYSTQTDDYVYLDDVTVEPVTEAQAPIVTYYDENGAVLSEAIAAPGSLLTPAGGQHKEGFAFDGWRDADGNQYLNSYFPDHDLKLYPSFKALPAGSDGHTDWSSSVTVDFEQTADALSFYGDGYNTDSAVYGPYFMVNDPESAHSGNNYFYFYKMGMWVEQWYRRMRFFGKDTPGHVITLDPQSVYKVSYWIRVDDLTSAGNLFLALYDESDKNMKAGTYVKGAENYMTPDVIIERLGQWYHVESLVMTPQDAYTTVGFVFYGGYLTAAIDDITITKLHDVTVTFETNGGTPVDPVIQLSQDYVIEPVAPERPGYVFDGWYTDPACKNRFRFTETLVNSDLKLYAKWVAAPEPPGPTYKTHYEYDTDYVTETVTTPAEPADPVLDAALGILPDTDPDLPAQTEEPTAAAQGLPWWAILLICVGGVLVAAGAATGILLAVKRSKKGGKGNA